MAQIRLEPPKPFNFRKPDDCLGWKRCFQQFREASGLSGESATKQISTFLYCLGEKAEAVLSSTNTTTEDRKDYARVFEKFDAFFQVRKNVIYERARNQQDKETAEQYIMALYDLIELKDEMLTDHLVVGIRDGALSEKLQLDSSLTQESAKKVIRQREAVHEQQQSLKSTRDKLTLSDNYLNTVGFKQQISCRNHRGQRRDVQPNKTMKQLRNTANIHTKDKCGRCGREKHPRDKCPAKEAQCHNCQCTGHYSVMCRQRAISTVEQTSISGHSLTDNKQKGWTSDLTINGKQISFKLDTGAEVTAISNRLGKQ